MKKVGYFCTFTPKEIIRAANLMPVRVLANNTAVSTANAHIQSYCCSQVKVSLERMLRGEFDFHGVVFTRSCDSLMRLADIWEKNSDMKVYSIEFPTKIDGRAKEFLKREFYDFKDEIGKWGEEITEESLMDAIEEYLELERVLSEVFRTKPDYDLVLKAETEDPGKVIEEAKKRLESEGDDRKRVLVTGSVCPFPEIFAMFEDVGFAVEDDLCTGRRFFDFGAKVELRGNGMDDLIDFLASKYLEKAPCPTKSYEGDRRFKYLLERCRDVDAVVFLLLKFCEPHFFDYPQLKEKIEEMGKKTLLLEIEFPFSVEQLRTRVEAFYEMLE
ncbi:Benzoyl-CoA reductase/2-hydroxyglutaryl-CoA dehydratase subunit, BcrC/BadD/HgdB [Archaeoglobus sulfaticallidus PM70-1]|uniref:Benzoyl-CoA reductase/2-hydroxyglutaryl-CoA dehydratase subunit, BcrC/BadD/HgdB n=1 Tax=Archaeoglobus sulfaticallidus PM70-1 TaxID=387631 RepID=N0BAP1_9EURY|nr:2-hydroxyacyl-CoA dehydratase [Archaeoglobus sulfaticallidus]AGK60679.1 Benzoyl-CoA reductase/2-hydroxyglutaryl-CoA dehydratase subunit, BcrC/BadD/HgdB [Archaeoglobus sulfaticallidus PM70-1]